MFLLILLAFDREVEEEKEREEIAAILILVPEHFLGKFLEQVRAVQALLRRQPGATAAKIVMAIYLE